MNGCKQCPAFAECTIPPTSYRGSECAVLRSIYGVETDPEIITNADRLRAMSDEEMVLFIDRLTGNCLHCESGDEHNDCPIHKISSGRFCSPRDIMAWLRQPVEGERHG